MVKDNKFNFTKERLSKIEIPKQGDKFYMDTQARGLGLRVSYGGSKIFYLYKKISNKLHKRKIGYTCRTTESPLSTFKDKLTSLKVFLQVFTYTFKVHVLLLLANNQNKQ